MSQALQRESQAAGTVARQTSNVERTARQGWSDVSALLAEAPYELIARIVLRIMGVAASGAGPSVEDAKAELDAELALAHRTAC